MYRSLNSVIVSRTIHENKKHLQPQTPQKNIYNLNYNEPKTFDTDFPQSTHTHNFLVLVFKTKSTASLRDIKLDSD